jgi:uncharacterized protein YuzE
MSITVTEITSSRTHEGNPIGIDFAVTLIYSVEGTADDQSALTAALAAAPSTYVANSRTLNRNTIRLSPEFSDTGNSRGLFFFEVRYATAQALELEVSRTERPIPIPKDKIPNIRRSGNVSSVQVRRPYSLNTLSTFGSDAPNFNGAIEVDEQGIAGVDIFSGQPTFSLQSRYTEAQFLSNRQNWHRYAEPAHVNNATYEGYPAGELLYLGCDYTDDFEYDPETDTLTVFYIVTFNFAVSSNGVPDVSSSSLPSGVSLSSKQGWDYLWIFRERPDPTGDPTNIVPKGAYYEKVYPRANFASDIGLPT